MPITIQTATPEQWLPAIRFFYRDQPDEERELLVRAMLLDLRDDVQLLNQFLIALRDEEIVGVMFLQQQLDQTAFFWIPIVEQSEEAFTIASLLLEAASQKMMNAGMSYAQFVLMDEELISAKLLESNGFKQLVVLTYLHRPLEVALPSENKISCNIILYDEKLHQERFANLIEQTYVETLDCPTFTHSRDGKDAILSHQHSGLFTPEHWLLFEVDGEDVGLLLMNDHPDQSAFEIVYMGVASQFRGKGYGKMLLQEGLQQIQKCERELVLLAVDENNCYATNLYKQLGFLPLTTRIVFLRNFA